VSVFIAGVGFEPATFGLWVSVLYRWLSSFRERFSVSLAVSDSKEPVEFWLSKSTTHYGVYNITKIFLQYHLYWHFPTSYNLKNCPIRHHLHIRFADDVGWAIVRELFLLISLGRWTLTWMDSNLSPVRSPLNFSLSTLETSMNIDAIQQRTRDALLVFGHHRIHMGRDTHSRICFSCMLRDRSFLQRPVSESMIAHCPPFRELLVIMNLCPCQF